MYKRDDLGTRMKVFYEAIPKTKLVRRVPVAIRIDGKSFHTFTRKFQKPFDEVLIKSIQDTMKYLCENIQGCVMGYTQSDEITLILVDYKKLTSDAWFDYEVQKCVVYQRVWQLWLLINVLKKLTIIGAESIFMTGIWAAHMKMLIRIY